MSRLQAEMVQLLREIDESANKAKWEKELPIECNDPTAMSFSAEAGDWRLLVVSFNIESQGFPKGSRGYDGVATRLANGPPVVMHLTRELAEKFYKAAEEAMTTAKRFTMRDEHGHVVAGLEDVEEGNALLTGNGMISYDKALSALDVGEIAHGTYTKGRTVTEHYNVMRTA